MLKHINFRHIEATPAMSTSCISILSLMSKWLFIPNIFSINIFAFQLCLCSKTVNMNQRVPRGDFSCPRRIFYYICYCLCQSQKSALTWLPYCLLWLCICFIWGAKIFQTTVKYTFFRLSTITVLIWNQTQYRWSITTSIISCLHWFDRCNYGNNQHN